MKKVERYFYFSIHLNFLGGFLYAFRKFLMTPRVTILTRRLWAYEAWTILSFYLLFLYLLLINEGVGLEKIKKVKVAFVWFKKVLLVNLVLLVFPWGVALLFAPKELLTILGINSIYWRILGACSLLGAIVYYFPYRFYKKKLTFYILVFGFLDNLIAGAIVLMLFFLNRVPLVAFACSSLLLYFSLFFLKQARHYKAIKSRLFSTED